LLNPECAENVQDCGKEERMSDQKINILYGRLSVEDERDSESSSIVNQRALLEEYAERNGLVPYVFISDDGFSGTGWKRPGWLKVIEEIENDNVSTLVCKDLSRLGRDYIRVGLFMEMFEEKNVRLILVNDGVDTAKGSDDFTPFRAIMAEWFARDCSRKVKSAFQAKGKKGLPISGKPPYGYKKDLTDKTKWVIDDFAASVVRGMFRLIIEGKSPLQICRILHDEKIEIPSVYLTKNGLVSYSVGLEAKNPYAWNERTVSRILGKEEYMGHVVNFRSSKKNFKSKRQTFHGKEDWLIFEDVHEPIVTKEEWEMVQKLCGTKRRQDKHGEVSPLTGLVFCAECGAKLYHSHRGSGQRKSDNFYECSTYNLGQKKFEEPCTVHFITITALEEIILEAIRKSAGYVRQYEERFIQMVRENSSLRQGETLKTYGKKIAKNERRIVELDKLFSSLYEDKVKGVITEERFAQMSGGFEKEQTMLREENAAMQSEIDAFNEDNQKADKFVSLVRKYTRFEELTTPMINEFVEKVVVHEAVWSEQTETQKRKGTRSQTVDVYLKYIGCFSTPDTRTEEEIEAERIAEEKLERRRTYNREYQRRKRSVEPEIIVPETTPVKKPKPAA